jgi:hypothetical protein
MHLPVTPPVRPVELASFVLLFFSCFVFLLVFSRLSVVPLGSLSSASGPRVCSQLTQIRLGRWTRGLGKTGSLASWVSCVAWPVDCINWFILVLLRLHVSPGGGIPESAAA